VILADFDPFLLLTPSKQALLGHFSNFEVHFWLGRTSKTSHFDFVGLFP